MTKLPVREKPVVLGRYRYSKWRWRVLAHALDLLGTALMFVWRRFRPLRAFPSPGRILLVQLDHLGDAILSSPLIDGLRSAFPEATIDVLASASSGAVFEINPQIRRVHLANRNWFERGNDGRRAMLSAVWTLGRRLRRQGYDLGIDVRGDALSVLVLALAGIPRRVGWTMGGGGFLLTDIAPWVPGRHEVLSRLALLERLGIACDDHPVRVSVHVSDGDRIRVAQRLREPAATKTPRTSSALVRALHRGAGLARARRAQAGSQEPSIDDADWLHAGRFGGNAPLLAVHLGAGTAAKRWPATHWRSLVGRFLDDGWHVIVVGGTDDVKRPFPLAPRDRLSNWSGLLTVAETTALLERVDLFIGADSGPAHLAACAGTPSVVLFSGTNRERQWRPWSRRSLVLRERVPCRPCHHKVCPLANHPCMMRIDPNRVYRAARRWWARLHGDQSPHLPL